MSLQLKLMQQRFWGLRSLITMIFVYARCSDLRLKKCYCCFLMKIYIRVAGLRFEFWILFVWSRDNFGDLITFVPQQQRDPLFNQNMNLMVAYNYTNTCKLQKLGDDVMRLLECNHFMSHILSAAGDHKKSATSVYYLCLGNFTHTG